MAAPVYGPPSLPTAAPQQPSGRSGLSRLRMENAGGDNGQRFRLSPLPDIAAPKPTNFALEVQVGGATAGLYPDDKKAFRITAPIKPNIF